MKVSGMIMESYHVDVDQVHGQDQVRYVTLSQSRYKSQRPVITHSATTTTTAMIIKYLALTLLTT